MMTWFHAFSSDRFLTLSESVRADIRDDGAVALDLTTGRCYSFNGLGAAILGIVDTGGPTKATLVAKQLKERYPHLSAELDADVATFLRQLVDMRLVRMGRPRVRRPEQRDSAPGPILSTDASPVGVDGFRLTWMHFGLAMACLVACDLALRCGGVGALRRLVLSRSSHASCPWSIETARTLGRAVDQVASYYYKHTWCLHRAAAKTLFLRIYRIPARAVVGYRPMPFFAHAWVQCGDFVLNEPDKLRTALRPIPLF